MGARPSFDSELETLNIELIRMAGLAEQAIRNSIAALTNRDKAMAVNVAEHDREIDEMEKTIETRCLKLLLRQQPVARDLRQISTALKMITDIERIGDQAADIAEILMNLKNDEPAKIARHIPEMARVASEMVYDSVTAFTNNDLEAAKAVIARDDVVDDLFCKVRSDLVELIGTTPNKIDEAIDVMMIAKYLERIGDHAVNICEWVEFYETGEYKNTKLL
ncbi:phosphate signaling complex protein PhoU [Acetanaerobacterium elongatum]|uniref:Phosphate-specific transport system accessory protein PhoU n=1 Tax=Acetanaerobacterium elongatum TaxID=258515 RepID=A0A1H0GXI7_9FIRM|nr:phosphate signaling complex protein PhoU [Acetanaerobacterium elongatum]SDO11597.1 phosphate uptake regulator, PhoU [Acetanaerobacterium elongatum]